jgi:hypothetical protein
MAVDGSVRISTLGRENNVRTCWKEEEEGFLTLWYRGAILLAEMWGVVTGRMAASEIL